MAHRSGGGAAADDPEFILPGGWSSSFRTGERINMATSVTADIWSGTALIRPLPLAPLGMSIVSTSAADNAGTGLGARTAIVTFIDEFGDWRVSDLLILAGVTPVAITHKPTNPLVTAGGLLVAPAPPDGSSVTSQIFRVQDMVVATVGGATEASPRPRNQGVLKVVDTATGTVEYDAGPIGTNRALSAAFHVPRGWRALSKRFSAGTARGRALIEFAVGQGPGRAWLMNPLTAVDSQTVTFPSDATTINGSPRSDFQIVATTGTNNVDVIAVVQLRLEPA